MSDYFLQGLSNDNTTNDDDNGNFLVYPHRSVSHAERTLHTFVYLPSIPNPPPRPPTPPTPPLNTTPHFARMSNPSLKRKVVIMGAPSVG